MKVIITIIAIMIASYVVLLLTCCSNAKGERMKGFDDLLWSKDNDGRKMAAMRLNDEYTLRVIEFSEDGIPYYIVHIWKDDDYLQSVDYMTRDDVSAMMERFQQLYN